LGSSSPFPQALLHNRELNPYLFNITDLDNPESSMLIYQANIFYCCENQDMSFDKAPGNLQQSSCSTLRIRVTQYIFICSSPWANIYTTSVFWISVSFLEATGRLSDDVG
jgi:hypothetical protein